MSVDLETLVERMWGRDHTVWKPDPTEIANRLGWLDLVETMQPRIEELKVFAADLLDEGFTTAVLLGMGGSSLAPEVIRDVLGGRGLNLLVMDTTHPAAVRRLMARLDIERTLFIVASKSGTTTETMSHLALFSSLAPASRFVAITDPGTPLEERARRDGFRRVFTNPPDIGGRYSALSLFGLVPAALMGADLDRLLESAREMADRCRKPVIESNPGAVLGVTLGEAVRLGRDKCTLVLKGAFGPLGVWIEQLLAESTGKEGTGVVPIVDEPGAGAVGGDDRMFVSYGEPFAAPDPSLFLPAGEPADLGAEFFRWEFATAVAGALLAINPFDQPNVEEAKAATRALLEGNAPATADAAPLEEVLGALRPGDHLSIQAFVDPSAENKDRLQRWRGRLQAEHRVATSVGFGPRFLHSTGQLHKGGPPTIVCVQVLDRFEDDVPIPNAPYPFGELIRAQADGDLLALQERGRRVARTDLAEV